MTVWLMSGAGRSRPPAYQGGIPAVAVLGIGDDEKVELARWLTAAITVVPLPV